VVLLGLIGLVPVCAVLLSDSDTSPRSRTASDDLPTSTEKFDRSNIAVLSTDPNAHKGAAVDVVGKVFGEVGRDSEGVYWQMFANPRKSEYSTAVGIRKTEFVPKVDDYVHVVGVVRGAFKGTNAFGGEITAISVLASVAEPSDALGAASPAKRTAALNQSRTQHGLTLVLEKVEFADDETRVFLTVSNGSQQKASFYSFNSKSVQGSAQFEPESFNDYPEIQSELLPGVRSSGVLSSSLLLSKWESNFRCPPKLKRTRRASGNLPGGDYAARQRTNYFQLLRKYVDSQDLLSLIRQGLLTGNFLRCAEERVAGRIPAMNIDPGSSPPLTTLTRTRKWKHS
jgi:hypothetical protein